MGNHRRPDYGLSTPLKRRQSCGSRSVRLRKGGEIEWTKGVSPTNRRPFTSFFFFFVQPLRKSLCCVRRWVPPPPPFSRSFAPGQDLDPWYCAFAARISPPPPFGGGTVQVLLSRGASGGSVYACTGLSHAQAPARTRHRQSEKSVPAVVLGV